MTSENPLSPYPDRWTGLIHSEIRTSSPAPHNTRTRFTGHLAKGWNQNHPHPAERTKPQYKYDSLYTGLENTLLFFQHRSHFNMAKFIRVSVTVAFSWRNMARLSRFQWWFYRKYHKRGKISNYRLLRFVVFEKSSRKAPAFACFDGKWNRQSFRTKWRFCPEFFHRWNFRVWNDYRWIKDVLLLIFIKKSMLFSTKFNAHLCKHKFSFV